MPQPTPLRVGAAQRRRLGSAAPLAVPPRPPSKHRRRLCPPAVRDHRGERPAARLLPTRRVRCDALQRTAARLGAGPLAGALLLCGETRRCHLAEVPPLSPRRPAPQRPQLAQLEARPAAGLQSIDRVLLATPRPPRRHRRNLHPRTARACRQDAEATRLLPPPHMRSKGPQQTAASCATHEVATAGRN